MTAFVSARIADANPMRTGWECLRIAKALYIIPFIFVFGSLLDPSLVEIGFDFLAALVMFALLSAAAVGYWREPLSPPFRVSLAVAAACLFMATVGPAKAGLSWLALGAAVGLGALTLERRRAPRREAPIAQPD
jgi:TRAP-type uncharacterized transport system fused permease subunit